MIVFMHRYPWKVLLIAPTLFAIIIRLVAMLAANTVRIVLTVTKPTGPVIRHLDDPPDHTRIQIVKLSHH